MENNDFQRIMDMANTVNYKSNKHKFMVYGARPKKSDISSYLMIDCQRIASILSEYAGEPVPVEVAYDLWGIHSEHNYCASFENIECVSDHVILRNLLGLLDVVEFNDGLYSKEVLNMFQRIREKA